ncbi:endo-1,4-beta-xylanase 1-like [Cornus florida]|uniref:endo-1,4-beta-xylanase 1-like n=1 Tax=Cornus florida TaxID=4283 RepID=UPI00289A3E69|nr:endo-1,4-beta-xylanase 1-like [Cornus florida]XP_059634333.1 endo-1,4-beta-xylanase 1-like [Cornus florida]XP_059634334.1 endo-1,4-beta-xylanase 1-like [Cornus florida]
MKRVWTYCFTGRVFKTHRRHNHSQRPTETMGNSSTSNANSPHSQNSNENMNNSLVNNILLNHDFSGGLHSWHPNCCDGFVVPAESGYAVITNRKECWQGLEQDITERVSPGSNYTVSACVGISGSLQGFDNIQATLKLERQDSATNYLCIGRISVSKEGWETLEGTFSLSSMHNRVVFYLEGPSPGVNLLIKSVVISCASPSDCKNSNEDMNNSRNSHVTNILLNHDFSGGLQSWHPNCCDGFVIPAESGHPEVISSKGSGSYAFITNRTKYWQGLEQDITGRVSPGSAYKVSASVGVSGSHGFSNIQATLKLKYKDLATSYLCIGRISVSEEGWKTLEGTFSLSSMPNRVVFYLEGPSPGVALLIKSVVISDASPSDCENTSTGCINAGDENILLNPRFEEGLNNWSGRGCKILLHDIMGEGKILPFSGKFFASATDRTQSWNGIQQEITGRVQRKLAYEVTSVVRIFGNNITNADVRITLWVQAPDLREQYIGIASLQATDKDWVQLQGKFLLNGSPSRVVIYLEGPPPGTDILINSLVVKHAEKIPPSPLPVIENPAFGVNIIANSNLDDGTNGWFPFGNCTLSVGTGSPHILPPVARDTLGPHEPLSGQYILVANRTQTWMGPAQMITDKLKLYLTYQVSAWVRIGEGATGAQNVNVALDVDKQWVNGGQVEVNDDIWHEIGGSFRIEKQPDMVVVYIQGPAPGVDLMVAGLQIFPVDRHARFKHLRRQTDKIRKRDVILKFSGSDSGSLFGAFVRVRQLQNSFPFGSCISRTNIDNEDFVDFFVKNFNWAVFMNELKWNWMEPEQGGLIYTDANELLELCTRWNIQTRGHCIFWEVEDQVQPWVCSLNTNDLRTAYKTRLTGLLTRYKGKFKHYDVNNEMLHGSFYQDRLGKEIRADMFKKAKQLDPSAELFLNDCHVEDGYDTRSSPEKYIQQICELQKQGAPVGGIGIQGHIDSPVGPIVCSALDKLGVLGLPIWFTELDVSSINEHVRADDLEVMLREAYAHPAVDGVMLWGFWELFMSRDNSHLVNTEGDINEAGKRYLALKQEWLSHPHGHIDEQGQFVFRGFQGSYEVEIITHRKKVSNTFVVDKGQSPLVVSIKL